FQVSHRELITACLDRKRAVIQTRALNRDRDHRRSLGDRLNRRFAFLRRTYHPRNDVQVAMLKFEFFYNKEVFAQPYHHGNPTEYLIDLQRQPTVRSLIGEPCQLECGREGERPVTQSEFARHYCSHERNNDVSKCMLRLEIQDECGE